MNVLQFIAVIKLLLENKEQILELIKLIQSLFASENLIGETQDATVIYDDSAAYPVLAGAVAKAGLNWAEFVKLLIDNADELKSLVKTILEVIELFKK
jgi:hypothetical protein